MADNAKKNWLLALPGLIIAGFIAWYFSSIIFYILAAAVLSIIGQPIVKRLDKIKIGKYKFPHTLSAALTLIILFVLIFTFIGILIPLLISQASALTEIDLEAISKSLEEPIYNLQMTMYEYGLLSEKETIETLITTKLFSFLNIGSFTDFFSKLFSIAGSALVAIFSTAFIAFFFLKEKNMFMNGVMLITPLKYQTEIRNILSSCRRLLTRYFLGLCIDVFVVITAITIGMTFLGLENAFVIGVIAGFMNIVPYVGPIIGGAIGVLLALSTNLEMDFYTQMLPLTLKMIAIFITVNIIDGYILQSIIFSKSVRAHPLELFLVILVAATIAGIPGMILAIPSYTVLRIFAKEFLSKLRIVQKITEKL